MKCETRRGISFSPLSDEIKSAVRGAVCSEYLIGFIRRTWIAVFLFAWSAAYRGRPTMAEVEGVGGKYCLKKRRFRNEMNRKSVRHWSWMMRGTVALERGSNLFKYPVYILSHFQRVKIKIYCQNDWIAVSVPRWRWMIKIVQHCNLS